MEIKMHLKNDPFNRVRDGKKTFEFRVRDEKRSQVSIGDTITFVNRDNPDFTVTTKVTALLHYKTFEELANDIHARYLGEPGMTTKKFLEGMYQFYSKREEQEFGVLGIKVELVK